MAKQTTCNQSFYLHAPSDLRTYLCVLDEQRHVFDFSDDTFKQIDDLALQSHACLTAEGEQDQRADYGCSYRSEFNLSRLLNSLSTSDVPDEGWKFTVNWLIQAGQEPALRSDTVHHKSCHLQFIDGIFKPVDTSSAEMLDQNLTFQEKERREKEYLLRKSAESAYQQQAVECLSEASQNSDVGEVLRILGDDLVRWARSLQENFDYHIFHKAKDPESRHMRSMEKDASLRPLESWIVQNWTGAHEAYELLEFHKNTDYAQKFSERFDRLHNARLEFSGMVSEYLVAHGGDDDFDVFDSLKGHLTYLRRLAFDLAEHLFLIASQFKPPNPYPDPKDPPPPDLELSDTKKLVLCAVLELGAVDEQHKVASSAIGLQSKLSSGSRIRTELAALRDLKLLGGDKGVRGYWLTSAGISEAKSASSR